MGYRPTSSCDLCFNKRKININQSVCDLLFPTKHDKTISELDWGIEFWTTNEHSIGFCMFWLSKHCQWQTYWTHQLVIVPNKRSFFLLPTVPLPAMSCYARQLCNKCRKRSLTLVLSPPWLGLLNVTQLVIVWGSVLTNCNCSVVRSHGPHSFQFSCMMLHITNFLHNPVVKWQHCSKDVYIVPGGKCYDVGSKASWTSSTPSSGCWKICSILSVGPYLEKIKEHGKETVSSDRAEFQRVQKDVTM